MIKRKIKILHLYKDFYPPIVGGIEKTINLMATKIAQDENFKVSVLVCNRGKIFTRKRIYKGVSITEVGEFFRFQSAPFSPMYPFYLLKGKFDILHFHFPNPTSEIAYLMVNPNSKAVCTYHSDIVRQKTSLKFYSPIMHKFLKKMCIIMPTTENYMNTSEILKKYKEKCRIVNLGLEPKSMKLSEKDKIKVKKIREKFGPQILLFVGVLRYYKGLHILIKAMKDVQINGKLLIVGKGPLYGELRRQIKRLKLENKIVLIGEVAEEELKIYYNSCDIFILPSIYRSEAYGLCQIEAQFCKKPIISSNLPTGVPFINEDKKTGLIVEPGNAKELTKAINYLLQNPDIRQEMGNYAYNRAMKLFTADVMINKLKQIYFSLL